MATDIGIAFLAALARRFIAERADLKISNLAHANLLEAAREERATFNGRWDFTRFFGRRRRRRRRREGRDSAGDAILIEGEKAIRGGVDARRRRRRRIRGSDEFRAFVCGDWIARIFVVRIDGEIAGGIVWGMGVPKVGHVVGRVRGGQGVGFVFPGLDNVSDRDIGPLVVVGVVVRDGWGRARVFLRPKIRLWFHGFFLLSKRGQKIIAPLEEKQ